MPQEALYSGEVGLELLEEIEGSKGDGSVESCPMEGIGDEVVQSWGRGRGGDGQRCIGTCKEM